MNATAQAAARAAIINEGPPPTHHTLKPHHLQILRIFQVLFITYGEKKFSSQFMLHIYRVLLVEVGEVRQPATYTQLIAAIEEGAKATTEISRKAIQEMKEWTKQLKYPEDLVKFFKDIKVLVPAAGDDDEEIDERSSDVLQARRSLFGYFVRRCSVSFAKLSFEAVEALWKDYFLWVHGELNESTTTIRKDMLTNSYSIFKTQADKKEYAQPEAYAQWEHGLAVGDEMLATENLRRFFEQHFHELNDSGVRQHALLNLARLHFLRHQYVACRKLLQEAIAAARTSNDKYTLQHCIGLQNRLAPVERGQRPIINELQPELHPMDVLYDAKKLLTVSYHQPMSAVFEKIVEASVLYDCWSDFQRDAITEAEQWGPHAVQALSWGLLGDHQLAAIEDQVVIAFTESGGADNTRLAAILSCAYHIARQGGYKDAISILLNSSVWRGLNMTDFQLWANEIWHILVLRASRRGQDALYRHYLLPKRPDMAYSPRTYWLGSSKSVNSPIRDPLYEVISMREAKQAHSAIEPLLQAVWEAEFMQRFDMYRVAIVLLADVGLEFGLTKWCRRIIEEIMPQLINGDDLEQRALACFTLARCIIAAGGSAPDTLNESLHYLQIAETDYMKLQMYSRLQDVQFLVSVVYHNLGITEQRDEAASRHQTTSEERTKIEGQVTEDWVTEVWEVVADIGSALAAR
ncbi:hypothetical protein NM688_g5456 [Phlebia brevispora]|uniref:Uncharacterized protein n=1 Tax=Phlebia brevispora TaxID=194682 RepID=A0ACC1SV67_9APHY|nr:hypothetical protein NM688_g5456 [Phlebia brevispora]